MSTTTSRERADRAHSLNRATKTYIHTYHQIRSQLAAIEHELAMHRNKALGLDGAGKADWADAGDLVRIQEELGELLAWIRNEGEPAECEGHEPGPWDPMGQTVYCDGSCR
jgi:hypothetical protein